MEQETVFLNANYFNWFLVDNEYFMCTVPQNSFLLATTLYGPDPRGADTHYVCWGLGDVYEGATKEHVVRNFKENDIYCKNPPNKEWPCRGAIKSWVVDIDKAAIIA